ncbi:hypothetical protein QL285_018607 [Trifolium repens]|nr:hypothetical protein QL285_018607 [Trifolium repens]
MVINFVVLFLCMFSLLSIALSRNIVDASKPHAFHHQRRRVRIHRSSPSQKSSSLSPIPSFIAIIELFTIAGNNTSPSPTTTQHHELIQPSSTFNRNKQQKDENKTGEIKKTSQRTTSSVNWPKGAKAQEVANIMDLRIAKKATLYYKEMLRKIADAT